MVAAWRTHAVRAELVEVRTGRVSHFTAEHPAATDLNSSAGACPPPLGLIVKCIRGQRRPLERMALHLWRQQSACPFLGRRLQTCATGVRALLPSCVENPQVTRSAGACPPLLASRWRVFNALPSVHPSTLRQAQDRHAQDERTGCVPHFSVECTAAVDPNRWLCSKTAHSIPWRSKTARIFSPAASSARTVFSPFTFSSAGCNTASMCWWGMTTTPSYSARM